MTRIDPISTPPCNARGTVYERVSGETISVKDPQRLAKLFARGDNARRAAEACAARAARATWDYATAGPFADAGAHVQTSVGLACTGMPPDVTARLFTERFAGQIKDALTQHRGQQLHPPGMSGAPVLSRVSQIAMVGIRDSSLVDDRAVVARASWDGAVAVYVLEREASGSVSEIVTAHIRPAIVAAIDLAHALGGYGDAHLTVLVHPRPVRAEPTSSDGVVKIGRGPVAIDSLTDYLDSIERELQRASGKWALES